MCNFSGCVDNVTYNKQSCGPILQFDLGTNPIFLYTDINVLERWPDLYSFSILSSIESNLSFYFLVATPPTGLLYHCGME